MKVYSEVFAPKFKFDGGSELVDLMVAGVVDVVDEEEGVVCILFEHLEEHFSFFDDGAVGLCDELEGSIEFRFHYYMRSILRIISIGLFIQLVPTFAR